VVVVEVSAVAGEVEARRATIEFRDRNGVVLVQHRLRTVPSPNGDELTAAIPLYAGVEVEGYSLSIRLRGDGVATLDVGVATLDLGFDEMRLEWPPWDHR
jgi:hypothetical protein